jgi:hypothetical protein
VLRAIEESGAQGAYRIVGRPLNSTNSFSVADFGNIVAANPVAARSYRQLQQSGTNVVLDNSIQGFSATGRARLGLSEVEIYTQNVESVEDAVATMIHESRHISDYQRGILDPFKNTHLDEFRAFRREFLYNYGRRPTLNERLDIRKSVEDLYPGLPSGR